MHRHHGPLSCPPAAPRLVQHLRSAWIVGLITTALLVGGCSPAADDDVEGARSSAGDDGGSDRGGDAAETERNADDGDGGADGDQPAFRNPQDDGFAPVVDNDTEPILPTDDEAEVSAPGDVIPRISERLATGSPGDEILDSIPALDGATDLATEPDGRSKNSSGEPATLDDDANLACAHAEIAVGQLDSGQISIALERIATAGQHAGRSDLATVRDWVGPLSTVIADGAVADLAPLVGFLSACTERGYEL